MAAGLSEGVRQCRFDRDGTALAIVWNPTGTARVPVPRGVTVLRRLDGTTSPVGAGGLATVTALPVLLTTTP